MYRALATGPIGVKVPFEEAVRLASAYGFQGISVSAAEVQELGVEEVRRLLEEHDLVAASTGMPVNFRQDDAIFEAGIADLHAFASAMSELGCTRVATWLMPWHQELAYADHFEQLRSRTARICQVLAQYGLRYGLEFVGPETSRAGKPHPFIHDLDGLLELIEAVGTDNLGVLLDSWHWYTSGGALEDFDKLSDRTIILVHVNDAPAGVPREEQMDQVRTMPGDTGVIDIETFLRALESMSYSGPVVVEPFSEWVRGLPPRRPSPRRPARWMESGRSLVSSSAPPAHGEHNQHLHPSPQRPGVTLCPPVFDAHHC